MQKLSTSKINKGYNRRSRFQNKLKPCIIRDRNWKELAKYVLVSN
jgi:hypothetical protein